MPLATHLALTASQACTVGDRSPQAELAWPNPDSDAIAMLATDDSA